MTRNQFDLVAKLIAAITELADQVVPDVVQFASRAEARAIVADIEEIKDWLGVLAEFANSRIAEAA
jgi:hypothetical protein